VTAAGIGAALGMKFGKAAPKTTQSSSPKANDDFAAMMADHSEHFEQSTYRAPARGITATPPSGSLCG
jgi:hypothetical protein